MRGSIIPSGSRVARRYSAALSAQDCAILNSEMLGFSREDVENRQISDLISSRESCDKSAIARMASDWPE